MRPVTVLRRPGAPAPRLLPLVAVVALVISLLATGAAAVRPAPVLADPGATSVTIAGSLDHLIGCSGDWDAGCAAAHLTFDANADVWKGSWTLPAGDYEYKAALDDSWNVNYGLHAAPGGANIPLHLAADTTVRFYFDPRTHWITDSVGSVIASVPGDFQSQLGCSSNWDPGCLRSWVEDPAGTGTYSFTTTALVHGTYQAKVALNESWDVNYGQGGVQNGPNLTFSVALDHQPVKFSYDPTSHVLSILAGHGHDNNVGVDGLGHDSQNAVYRQPFGATNPGTAITLRFRTFHDDVTGVRVRFYDTATSREFYRSMSLAVSDVTCFDPVLDAGSTCDYWQTTYTPPAITTLYYRFVVTDGTATAYYADDSMQDGGWGRPTATMVDNSYAITVFDPAFKPIPWLENAVIYQIFPDRFANGKTSNDASTTDPRYGYPPSATDQIVKKAWTDLPEGYCRGYVNPATPCTEAPMGRDYFGGDLRGIDQKLGYLRGLGVNTLYLNPVFSSASNHGYDTRDYYRIDPRFGSQQDWDQLQRDATRLGMHIILDGVFNHVSSDSPFFDRYHHFDTVGACEAVSSPYRSWFTFHPQANGPCAGPDGPNTMTYDAWFGFDSLAVLNKSQQAVEDLVFAGNDSVAKHWLRDGVSGWRLDVMNDGSFPPGFWQDFRTTVKSVNPNAPVIGELWKKADVLPMIHGDTADTTMNYRFRNAVQGFLGTVDNKGFPDDGASNEPPSVFAAKLQSIREDYPDATYYTLMNLLDSHDTQRILWSLTPGQSNREDKEFNAANLALGKDRQRLAALIQMTVPGAPTIYYGDEVGMTGSDDPDDRRTFPWTGPNNSLPGGDSSLLAWYSRLTWTRNAVPVLRTGALRFLLTDDTNRTLAYARTGSGGLAIVAINRSETGAQTLSIPLDGFLRNGVRFTDLLTGKRVTSAAGALAVTLPALGGAILLADPLQDLTGPAAPKGLAATAATGQVSLTWTATAGAASYQVWRSPISGGGYVLAGTSTTPSFTDTGLRNGLREYYLVKALDRLGNVGPASAEVSATPSLPVGYAVLQWPKTVTLTLGQSATIYGQVYVAGVTDAGGSPSAILAQVGYGATGSDPAAWTTWQPMGYNAGHTGDNNFEYQSNLLPTKVGTFDLLVRFSTDGGASWAYGDQDGYVPGGSGTNQPGVLTVEPSADTTPPDAPTGLHVTDWGPSAISLGWTASTASDVATYDVYRHDDTTTAFTLVGSVAAPETSYTDADVAQGTTYTYQVTAVDNSLNESGPSNSVSQAATPKLVHVTFRVLVPASTPPTDTVYLPGSIAQLGPWDPGKVAMTNKGGGIWETTVDVLDGTALEYKYTRGTWDRVEWWGSIVSTANRHVTISYGTTGSQLVDDTGTDFGTCGADGHCGVQFWRDPLVVSTTPAAGSSGAAPPSVGVTFERSIVPGAADYSAAVAVTKGGSPVAGTVAPSSGSTTSLTWTPAAPLTAGTYTVTVSGVKSDLGGDSVSMQQPYTFSFTVQ